MEHETQLEVSKKKGEEVVYRQKSPPLFHENVLSHSIHLLIQEMSIECVLCIKDHPIYMEIRYLQKATLMSPGSSQSRRKRMCAHIGWQKETAVTREVLGWPIQMKCCPKSVLNWVTEARKVSCRKGVAYAMVGKMAERGMQSHFQVIYDMSIGRVRSTIQSTQGPTGVHFQFLSLS